MEEPIRVGFPETKSPLVREEFPGEKEVIPRCIKETIRIILSSFRTGFYELSGRRILKAGRVSGLAELRSSLW